MNDEKKNYLLFSLFLVDVSSGEKQLLLPKALFVQWVIQSDVVVAQTDSNLEIWYNIDMPEHKTLLPVRGEVVEIIRANVCINYFYYCKLERCNSNLLLAKNS